MPENFLEFSQSSQPVWKRKLKRAGRAIQIWLREFIYSLIEITILLTATAVLVGILLSFLEAFWYLYLQTPVGIKYTADPSRLSRQSDNKCRLPDSGLAPLFLCGTRPAQPGYCAPAVQRRCGFQAGAYRPGRPADRHRGIDRSEPVPVSIVHEYFGQNITRVDASSRQKTSLFIPETGLCRTRKHPFLRCAAALHFRPLPSRLPLQ
jgi:hypothetical protein